MTQASLTTITTSLPDALPETSLLHAVDLWKGFTLHHQGGIHLSVLDGVSLTVHRGECVALVGVSGSGKSTFMRSLYGNYRIDQGSIWINHNDRWVDLPTLPDHELLYLRKMTIGYVSQFLRVIPRVPALDVAAEPLLDRGVDADVAYQTVQELFVRLNLPQRLWHLSPTTFSGGEKQRINIARAFAVPYPILLLDEPTSALDAENRQVVIEMIEERKQQGHGLIGIFHDPDVRSQVCTRELHFG